MCEDILHTSMNLRMRLLIFTTTLFLILDKKAGASDGPASRESLAALRVVSEGFGVGEVCREVIAHSIVLIVITTGSDPVV